MTSNRFAQDCRPVEIITLHGAQTGRVECCECGGQMDWVYPSRVPPERIKKYFIGQGWLLRKRATCPTCNFTRKEKPAMSAQPAKPNLVAVPNSDAAKKNKRLVILALEDYFDEAVCRYRNGKTDADVAKELDLAEGFVASVREEFFGKLAEPDEIGPLRAKLANAEKELAEIKAGLDALTVKNGWSR